MIRKTYKCAFVHLLYPPAGMPFSQVVSASDISCYLFSSLYFLPCLNLSALFFIYIAFYYHSPYFLYHLPQLLSVPEIVHRYRMGVHTCVFLRWYSLLVWMCKRKALKHHLIVSAGFWHFCQVWICLWRKRGYWSYEWVHDHWKTLQTNTVDKKKEANCIADTVR